jgi:hypothetical protein
MNTTVRVTANAEKEVITLSKENPEYGYLRVVQDRAMIDDKGWASMKTLSALVYGKAEHLQAFGYKEGDVLPGKIVIKESLEPFNTSNPDRDLKIAGKTGIICCTDGQPIYRKTFYNVSGNDTDELIAHNNTDAIKSAAVVEVAETVEDSANFDL